MAYPTSVPSFTTKNAGDTIQPAHVNDLQTEISGIEGALLTTGLAHHLLFVDATYDIGQSGATRPRHLYMSGNATVGGTLSLGGGSLTGSATAFAPTVDTGLNLGTTTNRWATMHSNRLAITDGIAAPGASVGYAVIYVDTADGDLKVVFGDGTVKTLAADT